MCQNAAQDASVPFVGCAADGQTGPVEAPKGHAKRIAIPPSIASELAYYESPQGLGVLGPRGWHCFGLYGSGGDTLVVSPQPIDFKQLWHALDSPLTGPAIEISHNFGGTSGRFHVAEVIARVFPAYMGFVRSIIRGLDEKEDSYPRGPYPADKLTYRSNATVEYLTPSDSRGIGTTSLLKADGRPIAGTAVLVGLHDGPDLVFLAVRLPAELEPLAPVIIRHAEEEAPRFLE